MATLGIRVGGLMMAFALAWVGVQGLLGIPDSNGKRTPKGTAVAALILAFSILIGTLIVAFILPGV